MSDCTVVFGDLSKSTVSGITNISSIMEKINVKPDEEPLFEDTWGDAFVAVFQSAKVALSYALDIRDGLRFYDWRAEGILHPPQLRMAIATGSIKWAEDKFQKRAVPEGEVFIEAARIEPIVTPGDIFVTEAVKNLAGQANFYYEDLGVRKLPKGYGSIHLFRALRSQERTAYGPLIDDQFFRRAEALRRFAYLWLLLDQLPAGSWGRSIPGWMREVWRGIPDHIPNVIMEDEGGFETTILNLELLSRILSPQELLQGIGSRAIYYLEKRHDSRGFGTIGLSRHGFAVEPHPRHTALAAWLIGSVLKTVAINLPELSELFKIAVRALFSGDPELTAKTFREDRNPLLLYMAAWHVYKQIQSEEWSEFFTEEELEKFEEAWLASKDKLLKMALRSQYEHGRPKELVKKRGIIYPLTIPYGEFVRMEAYSLLSAAILIDKKMPKRVRDRIGKGVKYIIEDYLKNFGQPKDRYTRDQLRPPSGGRGPKPYFAITQDEIIYPDLGTAAMLLRILRSSEIIQALWDDDILFDVKKGENNNVIDKISSSKVRYFLTEDLIELFDRYLILPQLYTFTHAGMFAQLLVGDHDSLVKALTSRCDQTISQPPPVELTDDSLDKVLSEKYLGELVEKVVCDDGLTPKIQMASHSIVRLLLDKLRPGRYLRENLSETGIKEISKQTCNVYKRPSFVEKYKRIWGNAPDLAILAPFMEFIGNNVTILDVGCGPGQYAVELSKNGHKVVLFDVSKEFINIAKERVKEVTEVEVEYFEGDILDPVVREEIKRKHLYDAIWCSGLFVHIPKAKQPEVLKWFHDILKPKGYFFVNVIIDNPCVFARDGRYFNYISTPKDFQTMLSNCGFKTEYMLQRNIQRNTYGEPFWENIWANFYARKSTSFEEFEPSNIETSLTSLAYERTIEEFISVHKGSDPSREKLIKKILDKLEDFLKKYSIIPPYYVLDVGCGPGDFVIEMVRRGWKGVGLDISDKMIQLASKECSQELKEAEFHVGDMRDLPKEWTDRFHAVICITAFQHIPFKNNCALKVLKEFYRILKPGGILRVDLQLGRETGYDPDLRFIQGIQDVQVVASLFEQAGFTILEKFNWSLEPGKNSYRRPISFHFVDFWLRKK